MVACGAMKLTIIHSGHHVTTMERSYDGSNYVLYVLFMGGTDFGVKSGGVSYKQTLRLLLTIYV